MLILYHCLSSQGASQDSILRSLGALNPKLVRQVEVLDPKTIGPCLSQDGVLCWNPAVPGWPLVNLSNRKSDRIEGGRQIELNQSKESILVTNSQAGHIKSKRLTFSRIEDAISASQWLLSGATSSKYLFTLADATQRSAYPNQQVSIPIKDIQGTSMKISEPWLFGESIVKGSKIQIVVFTQSDKDSGKAISIEIDVKGKSGPSLLQRKAIGIPWRNYPIDIDHDWKHILYEQKDGRWQFDTTTKAWSRVNSIPSYVRPFYWGNYLVVSRVAADSGDVETVFKEVNGRSQVTLSGLTVTSRSSNGKFILFELKKRHQFWLAEFSGH